MRPRAFNVQHFAAACAAMMLACTGADPGAQQARADDVSLATSVRQFFEAWIVAARPDDAATRFLSPLGADERFLPESVAMPASESARRSREWMASDHPMTVQTFNARMTTYLTAVARGLQRRRSVGELLLPMTIKDARAYDDNLGDILQQRRARPLPELATLAYPVRTYADLQWLASGTVAYRTVVPGLVAGQQARVEAVVSRLACTDARREPRIVVTVWTVSTTTATFDWKLLGVEVAPVQ